MAYAHLNSKSFWRYTAGVVLLVALFLLFAFPQLAAHAGLPERPQGTAETADKTNQSGETQKLHAQSPNLSLPIDDSTPPSFSAPFPPPHFDFVR